MAETTFFVEPDGNLTRALQRKFPKLTIQEIERRKIPDVLRLNPDITNPNIVQAGIPYYVTDEERTFSRYPTDRVSDYAQANVSKLASDRIVEMNRLSLLSDARWAAEINAERAKTDKVGGLYTAFTGRRYARSPLVTSSDAPSAKKATSSDKKRIEQDEIWRMYQELLRQGKEPRSKAAFEKWISAINPSAEGAKYIFNEIADNYDWGDWVKLEKVDPDDPFGPSIEIYRQENSPEFYQAIEGGFSTGSVADDREAAKRKVSMDAVKNIMLYMRGDITEAKYKTYYNKQTDPIIRAALESWANEQGFDNPGETFAVVDEKTGKTTYEWAQKGTDKYSRLDKSGARRASASEWANVDFSNQRERLLKTVDNYYEDWRRAVRDNAILTPNRAQQWVQMAFKDDLHLIDPTNSIPNIASDWMSGAGQKVVAEDAYNRLNSTLQDKLNLGDDVFDDYVKIINESDLPAHGDNSKKSMIDKWKGILDQKLGWSEQPAIRYMGDIAIEGKQLGRIGRDGTIHYNDKAPFMTEDPRYALTKGNKVTYSPAEKRDWSAKERNIVYTAMTHIEGTTGFKQMDEGYRDVHQRYFNVENNLVKMAKIPVGERAWGVFDQQIADLWKKLTDESMITSEEFRTILEGTGYLQQLAAFLRKRFSEDATGSFLTPEQRRGILEMTRMALEYKQERAKEFFDTIATRWNKDDLEIEAFNKATGPITEFINQALPEFDVYDPKYAEVLNLSPKGREATETAEGIGEYKFGRHNITMEDAFRNETWTIKTPTGETVPFDIGNPEHKKWAGL